ncbi:MAG: tRNA (adenosine(37)-N6)-threonylcarbamoyltransferase complex ATPase subunit type 1 TsaE [Synergistaceae bacterium]|nr:tRNA (adenosine(37)-N6)-threonylcarbamoyltransferase complex ATPase subunit type 1 TsaE [Synergistaceae bacterium]
MTAEFLSHSEEDTRELGRRFAECLKPEICVLLFGDLGAGKTVFVRGVGEALGISGVRSPSFTLVNEYEAASGQRVIHADLYRLDDADSLGLEEYCEDCVLFVEWPERWKNPPQENVLKVYFSSPGETERVIKFQAQGEIAEGVLSEL